MPVTALRSPRGRKAALVAVALAVLLAVVAAGLLRATGDRTPSSPAAVVVPSPSTLPPVVPEPVVPVVLVPDPSLRSAALPELDIAAELGPPPGPRTDPRPSAVAPPAARFALLVGVTDYRAPTVDTIGSAKDATFLAEQLLANGWLAGNVRVLLDAEATGAALREGLDWLAERSQPGTFALFHYSGHVKQKGGTREALWPVDRAFLDDTALVAALAPARGRMWVDIAGCEAGSFGDGFPTDRVLFTASSKQTEKSYEYPEWGMSIWTGLVFDLGLRQGRSDADGDGRTTVGEALRYGQYYAQAISLGQQPYGQQTPEVSGPADLGWTLADPPA
jgi:hypothetical protein